VRLRLPFAALAAPALCLMVFCVPLAASAGGDEALMREWAAKKRQARERVFQGLQDQGLLPRDGTVSFEAVVKPDPDFPDKTRIVIQSIRISPTPSQGDPKRVEGAAAAEAMAAAFKPVDMSHPTIFQSLDVPVGATLTDELTVEDGRLRKEELAPPDPVPAQPAVEPQAAPAPTAELSWWDNILEFFRF
jgi:hypothetical protein